MISESLPARHPQDSAGKNRHAAEAVFIGAAVAGLYLATLAGNHTEAEDAVRYMLAIRSGDPAQISSPYHVLWHWVAYGWVEAVTTMGYVGDPYPVVQVLDAALGAAGVSIVWFLLRGAGLSRVAAAAGAGMLAFSYGYWWYSVEAEVYVLSGVCLLLALGAAQRSVTRPTIVSFCILGTAIGLAILGHITNGLVALVVPVAALAAPASLRTRIWRMVASGLFAAAVVLPAYAAAAGAAGVTTAARIPDWLTGYAQTGRWGHLDASNVYEAVVGSARAIVGGHFLFALPPVESVLRGQASEKLLREEFFLADSFSGFVVSVLSIGAVVAAGALLVLVSGLVWLRSASRPALLLLMPAAAMLIPLTLLAFWFEPFNHELWIAPLALFCVVVGIAASRLEARAAWRRAAPLLVAVFLASLFVVNLFGSVLPQHSEATDYWRTRVRWYEENGSEGDLVLAANYQWTAYIRYFGHVNAIDANELLARAGPERSPAAQQIVDNFLATPTARRLVSNEILDPASDPYSTCGELETRLVCEAAPTFRRLLTGRLRLVSDEPLELVWQLR